MTKLLNLLKSGEVYSREELSRALKLPDRTVRRMIHDFRRQGYWIVNGEQGGYKLTKDPTEWNSFCQRERRRALNTFKKTVDYIDGQTTM